MANRLPDCSQTWYTFKRIEMKHFVSSVTYLCLQNRKTSFTETTPHAGRRIQTARRKSESASRSSNASQGQRQARPTVGPKAAPGRAADRRRRQNTGSSHIIPESFGNNFYGPKCRDGVEPFSKTPISGIHITSVRYA